MINKKIDGKEYKMVYGYRGSSAKYKAKLASDGIRRMYNGLSVRVIKDSDGFYCIWREVPSRKNYKTKYPR